VHVEADGKATVVSSNGKPLSGQPIIQKVVDEKGVEKYVAYYPGGEDAKVEISASTASLEGCYALVGADGKVTVVGADGKPVDSPPTVVKVVDSNGVEKYVASCPGVEGVKAELPAYSAPIQGCYAHAGPDGKITIVDSDGKPLASQPAVTKVVDSKGLEHIVAWYPGGAGIKVPLNWYKPPSAPSKAIPA
jgi:hypothetical protein